MYVYRFVCVQMFLLMRYSKKKIWKNFRTQSFYLYTGILSLHSNKIQSKFLAPSEDKRSLLVSFFFFPWLFPLFLNWDEDGLTLYLVLSKFHFFTGEVSG